MQLVSSSHGDWDAATPYVQRQLNNEAREPQNLVLYKLGLYECTYNKPGVFNQSQLAVLEEVPSQSEANEFQPLKVLVAPPGTKHLDEDIITVEQLLAKGWTRALVGEAPSRMYSIRGGVKAKRQQYALRHRIAGNAHSTMGNTLTSLATEISTDNPDTQLWEKGQAIVILSRNEEGKKLYLVNKKGEDDTIQALVNIMLKETQYDRYMEYMLEVLVDPNRNVPQPIDLSTQLPFRPLDNQLPEDTSGYCYMILSLSNRKTTYIGQTLCLPHRLDLHNSGYGAKQTSDPHLRPWALVAYVSSFQQDKTQMRHFERLWQQQRDRQRRRNHGDLDLMDAISAANTVIGWGLPSFSQYKLQLISYCGRLPQQQEQQQQQQQQVQRQQQQEEQQQEEQQS